MGSHERMAAFLAQREEARAGQTGSDDCRARVMALLDADSFVELESKVESRGLSFGFTRDKVAGDGVVTGYGTIEGRLVYVAAQDPAVFGGSVGEMHAAKITRTIERAVAAGAPFIGLYDSGGARIEEGIVGLAATATMIAALDQAAGQIPLFALIYGPCAGGLAFAAAASDFVLMCPNERSGIFVNGPMVVAAVEQQEASIAAVGGQDVLAEHSDLVTLKADSEAGMVDNLKRLLNYLPNFGDSAAFDTSADDPNRAAPELDELAANLDAAYDARQVIEHIVDTGSFLELNSQFAAGMVTGFACLGGLPVGLVANGVPRICSDQARKAARFIDLCSAFYLPLITLTNAEGFVISSQAEHRGLARAGARLFQAFSNCDSVRINVIVGPTYGSAYATMNNKASGADLVYAWPTAEIAVVPSDAAAHIVYRRQIAESADPANDRKKFVDQYGREIASPTVAAKLGQVDEMIQPQATRPRLISGLMMLSAGL